MWGGGAWLQKSVAMFVKPLNCFPPSAQGEELGLMIDNSKGALVMDDTTNEIEGEVNTTNMCALIADYR